MATPTPAASQPEIRTLLLCDLVASTRLVERVGDAVAGELLARHDRCARDLLSRFNGREIDKSDGFLLLFQRPIEAVRFAIAHQAELREIGAAYDSEMLSRVGIHLGEVVLRANPPEDVARGAKPLEVEGLAKAIAARVMSLAGEGRILLTRTAYDFARRGAVGAQEERSLRWAAHGLYRLAGVEEPVEVCEVAEPGEGELTAPPSSEKARRADEAGTQTGATDPLLAVLAFDNLSSDPEMQFFSDGVSEEIIQRLSRGSGLKVIAPTSSAHGWVSSSSGSPQASGPTARPRSPTTSRPSAPRRKPSPRTTAGSEQPDRGAAAPPDYSGSTSRAFKRSSGASTGCRHPS